MSKFLHDNAAAAADIDDDNDDAKAMAILRVCSENSRSNDFIASADSTNQCRAGYCAQAEQDINVC